MYDQEKQRATHLMILIYNTIFIILLTMGAVFLKSDLWAVTLFVIALFGSWMMHITERIPAHIRLWMYIMLAMLTYSYFAIYEMALYDLASVMMILILICTVTEERTFVRLCAVTYYLTMCYKMTITYDSILHLPIETVMRVVLHFLIIFAGERLAETVLQRRRKERLATDEKIVRLEEANRRVEDFLANVSHELRTPINAVTGITAVMLKNETDPEKKKDIRSIQLAGYRLFSQIEDILDYMEIDTGRIVVSEENYMITSLINDIIVENRLRKSENQLELIFDMDADIPSTLLGDGRKIKKIMKHLIDNAIKFTKSGGVYIRISGLHKAYGVNLCIQVRDTGVGISEEELGKTKERFFQVNGGRNRRAGGLGLGLSIVYGMVTTMGGFIQLESVEGSGTTVSVSIPQKVVDSTPSMEVPNRAELCIALYLRPEKYEVPEIRDFYNTTISHMVQQLDLTVHRVFELEELKRLVAKYQLTHLVIGKEEYEENASYYEGLDKATAVITVADDRFRPMENSRVLTVRKPFYSLPIVNILSAQASLKEEAFERDSMICPGIRVLVVDDEPMNLMVAEGIFKDYQMTVKTAGGGREAIKICEKEEFDLIFLDHMMPEMDGVETLKILRKKMLDAGRSPTFIAFTANAVSGAREMFLQEGFDEFISKPVEDQELKRLLKKVLPATAVVYVDEHDRKTLSERAQKEGAKQAAVGQPIVQKSALQGAGFMTDQELEEDTLICLERLGFHTEAGLIYCRGDKEYYEKLLTVFAKNADGKIAEMESSFRTENLKDYQIMVHALKSSAKMVGADALSAMAKNAEEAAKNQDVVYIREHHEELLAKYRETVQNIWAVVSHEEPALKEEIPATGAEMTEDELLSCLSELKKSLDLFDANTAETLLAEMSEHTYQGTSVRELLQEVRQDVENFELVAASEKVEALMPRVSGGKSEEDDVRTDHSHYLEYGISIENGLSLTRGNMELYLDLIDSVLRDRKRQETMQQFIAEENMKDYAISVHGLKGNARTVGADKLADIAYEHEMKSKAGDLEYVKAHWDELVIAWDITLDGLKEFYCGYREREDEKYDMPENAGGEVRELSQSELAEVVALLEDFETNEATERLKTWISTPLEQGMHARIKGALIALEDEFDRNKAIELLKDNGR